MPATFSKAVIFKPGALAVLALPAIVWIFSPVIVYLVSKPILRKHKLLNPKEVEFARAIARRTWSFFETFVTAEDNWLPPDNFQEDPAPVVVY